MNANPNQDSLRSKALTLAPIFKASVGLQAAVSATTIPRSTVSRFYRVMRLLDEGRTDQEIADSIKGLSARSIAEIRSAYSDAIGNTRGHPSIERFLAEHRQRLYGLVERLAKQVAKERITSWPTQWIRQSWPEPFTGQSAGAPVFDVETEPGFDFTVQHLESLRLGTMLESVKVKAIALKECSLRIMYEIPGEAVTALPDDMVRAAVLYGSQMAEDPNQDYPEMTVVLSGDSSALHINAYSSRYELRSDAEQAANQAREVIDFVKGLPATHRFYDAREELMDALEAVHRSLGMREAVNLQIDRATCQQCGPLKELSNNPETS